jgi:hypothetical protein
LPLLRCRIESAPEPPMDRDDRDPDLAKSAAAARS